MVEKFKNNVNARKKREKKIRKVVDGRTLAKTGRVEQLNVRVTEDVKQLVISAAAAEGIHIAELIERIILDALGSRRKHEDTGGDLFGISCGAIIIAIVSRYGYQSADNALDGAIWGLPSA